ncbi:hypothetical protein [Nostoc sp.]
MLAKTWTKPFSTPDQVDKKAIAPKTKVRSLFMFISGQTPSPSNI